METGESEATQGISFNSWSDHIKSIERRKKGLTWDQKSLEPVKFVTRYDMSRRERVFDPILQNLRDQNAETTYKDQEKSQRLINMNLSRDKQLRFSQTFDILNHQSKLPGGDPDPDAPRKVMPASRTPWNIVSNLDTKKHYFGRVPIYEVPQPREGGKRTKAMKPSRDYNILNNRYIFGHREKSGLDKQYERHRAAIRYWQTHDENPLLCRYYDPLKEDNYIKERDEEMHTHGKDVVDKLPFSFQIAEGNCYDILNKDPKDEMRFQRRENMDNKQLSLKLAKEFEDRATQNSINKAELNDRRALNRISDKRLTNSVKHGFNIITNNQFTGMNGVPVPQVYKRTYTAWDRLTLQRAAAEQASKAQYTAPSMEGGSSSRSSNNASSPSLPSSVVSPLRPQTMPAAKPTTNSVPASSRQSSSLAVSVPKLNMPQVRTGGFH